MLLGQFVAVDTGYEQRQFVGRLGHRQPLEIGPRIDGVAHTGRLFRVVEGDHTEMRGGRERLDQVDECLDRKTRPGHGHGPGFHAAVTVQAFLQRHTAHEVVDVERLRLVDQPGHLDLPGPRPELRCERRNQGLAGTELVEVVVRGGLALVG